MVKIELSTLLGRMRWTQAQLAEVTGIRPNTISEIYHEMATRISLEHIDKICRALDCDISDLLKLVPDTELESLGEK